MFAEDIGCPLTERNAAVILAKASGAIIGIHPPRLKGERMDTTPTPWVWEGVVMAGTLNLLVAPPKIGKSAIMVGMIAAWYRGESHYLGQPLHGECPPVFIIGTDQPENDWYTLFRREGLVDDQGNLGGPIEMLWHTGAPLHLTTEGIAYLGDIARSSPGALFLLDSYHACISPLGIDEATSAFDGPARDLSQVLAPHRATSVLVHHANKSVSGGTATNASRGSNALPAAASLTILMNWLKQPAEGQTQTDYRVVLKTQGRAKGTTILAQLHDHGWESLGDGATALQAEALAEAERELTGRQADIFDYIADRWSFGEFTVQVTELASHFNLERNKVHRCLSALIHKGLIRKAGEMPPTELGGRPSAFYAPALPGIGSGHTPLPPRGVANVTNRINPSDDDPGQGDEPVENLTRVQERRGLSPFSPLSPPAGGGGVYHPGDKPGLSPPSDVINPPEQPEPSTEPETSSDQAVPVPGMPVERLVNGNWFNGWVIKAVAGLHWITITKVGRPSMVQEPCRWLIDIRPCSSPF